ncbi:MAG: xanthine dehydrogenase family protein molybdopterin-binding subunit [Actinomycetota bacterium]|uniref:Aldehyde oxidase/xanthine dehydrogenase a/b hammerhead domain-containing protein n=1 Tax=marine metagenome TaxID=408172 RepID=A0A381VZ72_9ZZZZ|nr:xanthine dehydrogenase family protein molybdopterin-binding subunit [Actinomycetota bacterium]MEE2806647.1 xanthine dehydrogenase family protein molybdopterin-binding subunit [Actinomycetota bacterium]
MAALRVEDDRLLRGAGRFMENIAPDDAAFISFVRSTASRARITAIDRTEAREHNGVIEIFTGADVDLEPFASPVPANNQSMLRPWIAVDRVRYVGEIVAIVVSENAQQGVDASELVIVDYQPLNAVVDPEEAATDNDLLDEAVSTNASLVLSTGDDEALFGDCEIVVTQRLINNRLAPCPLENRGAVARWDGPCLEQWSTTQSAHAVRDGLSRIFELDPDNVRVVVPDVGGSFGAKRGLSPPEVLTAWVAKKIGRPARWHEGRSEAMVDLGHGRGQIQYAELGGDRDGTLKAFRAKVLQNAGAYPDVGSFLPRMLGVMGAGPYALESVEIHSRSVLTNTAPLLAYRGAGRPESTSMLERMVDLYSHEIEMDPAALRHKNLITQSDMSIATASGAVYDSGDYPRALESLLDTVGYEKLRRQQRQRRQSRDSLQLGLGISSYVEITNPGAEGEYGAVEVLDTGRVVIKTGSVAQGHSHSTGYRLLVSEMLGVDTDEIDVVYGDTALVPRGTGTGGSKSTQIGGSALFMACENLIEQGRELAANLLEANADDVIFESNSALFHIAGTPSISVTWADLREHDAIKAEADYTAAGATFPFGAHFCLVEVDLETGEARILRYVALDDCGRTLSPVMVEGQVHGGVAQGIGQALFEEFRYDKDGNPLTTNFADYAFAAASDLPAIERLHQETPTNRNPIGVKGIGEAPTIGSPAAVQNAVIDAVAHLGVRHIDMPLTPNRVWGAIQEVTKRSDGGTNDFS